MAQSSINTHLMDCGRVLADYTGMWGACVCECALCKTSGPKGLAVLGELLYVRLSLRNNPAAQGARSANTVSKVITAAQQCWDYSCNCVCRSDCV